MNDFYVELGQLIKVKRLEKNFTTQQLADKLGVSIGFLNNLENAKTDTFNIELILNLSKTLDISLLNFLPLSEDAVHSNDTLKTNHMIETPITVRDLLSKNIDTITSSYINSIKTHEYNSDFIAKITDKVIQELNFIDNFKLK